MGQLSTLPESEMDFLNRMFSKDVKNYHVWSYRQWLVRHFSLWDKELSFVEQLLDEDVRNNSAWNHRWFVVFGRSLDPAKQNVGSSRTSVDMDESILEREIEFTKTKIDKAPQNQSPWIYLRGILRHKGDAFLNLKGFVEQYASLEKDGTVRSSHGLELLVDIYAKQNEYEKSATALSMLSDKYDPIRKNYWDYKKKSLGLLEIRS